MHIEKIKYFLDLYNCCNYTETARKNYISQASLSQYINSLEDTFHVRLFDRVVSPIVPTTAGDVFYGEAKILWIQYQNMLNKMSHVNQKKVQPLRIAYTSVTDSISIHLLCCLRILLETYIE